MSSEIFECTILPSRLHITDGKTIVKLNTNEFVTECEGQLTPNFFRKLNGTFLLMESGAAGILETHPYEKAN